MKVGELIKKLNKRDKSQIVYYVDKYGKHEITDVQPMLTKDGSATIIMNGDGGRYDCKTESQTGYDKYREKIKLHDPHKDW